MKEIRFKHAYYIKLGRSGKWEKECVDEKQTLRFGYHEISHQKCLAGRWKEVEKELNDIRLDKGAVSRDLAQIRAFYESGQDVLWVTFYGNHLWWCFANPDVKLLPDGSRERSVAGKWSNMDIKNQFLAAERLRGSLLAMQAYRGTICAVRESEYLLIKLNGLTPKSVEEAQTARKVLIEKIEALVNGLHPSDFELLIDLIFRESGWRRVGVLGKTQKTIDLELVSSVTNEKMLVQVKSRSTLAEYNGYKNEFSEIGGYSKGYFIVHTPDNGLKALGTSTDELKYMGPKEVAKLCIDYGLADWVIAKAE